MEPPSRVTLGAYPNPALGPGCLQDKTLWNVPVLPIRSLPDRPDSAVVIYWGERQLAAGARREVAFAYGLGQVAAGEAGGQLGLSVAGSFAPRGEFTLTAEGGAGRMVIRDSTGATVCTLDVAAGQTSSSALVLLRPGLYTVEMASA